MLYNSSFPCHAADAWAFGCLIYQVYNGKPTKIEDLLVFGKIPKNLIPFYQRFLQQNPKLRLSFAKFIETAKKPNSFFDDDFVNTSLFLDEIALKSDVEKQDFIK